MFSFIPPMTYRRNVNLAKEKKRLKAVTSTITGALIFQVVSTIVAHLLLWVREHSEGLAHLLEFLFLLLLHLWSCRTVAVCKKMIQLRF